MDDEKLWKAVGGILTAAAISGWAWWDAKYRVAKETRRPVGVEQALNKLQEDFTKMRSDFNFLRDVTVKDTEMRVASLDKRQERDHSEVMRYFSRMDQAFEHLKGIMEETRDVCNRLRSQE